MHPKVIDVERLKKQVRKLAAGQVLSGAGADVCLDLGQLEGCQTRIAAGYGPLGSAPQLIPRDRLIWILDGYAEIKDTAGQAISVSQGESTVLSAGKAYHLDFPQLTIYLTVEAAERD